MRIKRDRFASHTLTSTDQVAALPMQDGDKMSPGSEPEGSGENWGGPGIWLDIPRYRLVVQSELEPPHEKGPTWFPRIKLLRFLWAGHILSRSLQPVFLLLQGQDHRKELPVTLLIPTID